MIASETLSMATIEERLPRCIARYAALEDFTQGRPWGACKHVVDGSSGVLCVEHPAAGVMCTQCTPHHVRRHGEEIEFRCDEFRSAVEAIHALVVEAASARLVVQDTRGRRRPMLGRLWIIGCGVCPACLASQ